MQELEAKLAELEGKVTAVVGKLRAGVATSKSDVESVDQGPLRALDAVMGQVEAARALLLSSLSAVEARVASMRPE